MKVKDDMTREIKPKTKDTFREPCFLGLRGLSRASQSTEEKAQHKARVSKAISLERCCESKNEVINTLKWECPIQSSYETFYIDGHCVRDRPSFRIICRKKSHVCPPTRRISNTHSPQQDRSQTVSCLSLRHIHL